MSLRARWILIVAIALFGCSDSGGDATGGTEPGDETSEPGDETSETGDETSETGDETSETGDETSETGDSAGLPVGSVCATAADCEQPLACLYAGAAAEERTCVDLTTTWDDDGSLPEVQVTGKSGAWARKRVTDWEALGAVCNDGSPYAYYVSPGSGEGADKWLFMFKGGGGCGNDEACAIRWGTQRNLMTDQSTKFEPAENVGIDAGIFSRDEPTNHFSEWNYVYLYYCTSDAYAGTMTAEENESRLHFRGRSVAEVILAELLSGIDITSVGAPALPPMSEASILVVAGVSAGASGARSHMDAIASAMHDVNPDTVTLGLPDSAMVPGIQPLDFGVGGEALAYQGRVLDEDCMAAHPDAPSLCSDAVHLMTGGGFNAEWLGQDHEGGHLGVPGASESAAVTGTFTYMSQFDAKPFTARGVFGWCVRDDCTDYTDCAAGQGCFHGRCYTADPCEPTPCTPDSGACYGLDDAPSCLAGVATHASQCNDDATCPGGDGCCEDGEECFFGLCRQVGYDGCADNSQCPDGSTCSKGICSYPAPDPLPQNGPPCAEYFDFVDDVDLCELQIGCHKGNLCDAGYTCMEDRKTPLGQGYSWGIRQAMSGHEAATNPRMGAFAARHEQHTAILQAKYYGNLGVKVDGHTIAEVLGQWMTEDLSYYEHIAIPEEVPIPLWVTEIVALTADGISATTEGTGCDEDGVLFGLCALDGPCASAADLLAGAGVGDTGTSSLGGGPVDHTALTLLVAPNPACAAGTLELAEGSYLSLSYKNAVSDEVHTRKIALPSGTLGADPPLPVSLQVGADGATWFDPELSDEIPGEFMAKAADRLE